MNEIVTVTTFALQIGTKKAPVEFNVPRVGVALAGGKAGTEARRAEKASLPHQAANGGFHSFAGFLAATFPKACAAYEGKISTRREIYAEELVTAKDSEAQSVADKLDQLNKAASPTNKAGFTVFVQCVREWAANAKKLTKAQEAALAQVDEYVRLVTK